jgi:hypothetical protein
MDIKINYAEKISRYNTTDLRTWIAKILAIIIPALLMSFFINISPMLTVLLFVICIFTIMYWINPKKTLLAFGIFLVFQGLVLYHTGGVLGYFLRQIDEPLIVIFFILTILKRLSMGRPIRIMPIGLLLFCITVIGFISSYANQITGLYIAMSSYLLMIKGFLVFYIFLNMDFEESELRIYAKTFLMIGLIVVLTTFINITFPGPFNKFVGGVQIYRMGMLSAVSIFGHPGGLGSFMAILTCFSFAYYIITKERKLLVLIIFFLLTMLLSLRITPALGVFLAVLFAILVLSSVERKRAIALFSSISVTLFLFFADKILKILSLAISGYVTSIDPYKVARDALYLTGFKIAWDYFPFGAGFGTFGGWMSRVYYSPLYYKYGLNRIWGLSPDTGNFINDTFWPHILAELGIIGCIFYLLIFYQFFRYAIKGIKSFDTPYQRAFAVGTCMVLVSSLFESIKVTIYEMSLWGFLIFGSMGIICSLLRAQESKVCLNHIKDEK